MTPEIQQLMAALPEFDAAQDDFNAMKFIALLCQHAKGFLALTRQHAALVAENGELKSRRVTAEMVKAAMDDNVQYMAPTWQNKERSLEFIAARINAALQPSPKPETT